MIVRTYLLVAQRLHDVLTFFLIQHHSSILPVDTMVLHTIPRVRTRPMRHCSKVLTW